MWNQYLVNLGFDDNKQGLKLMIIFQMWLGKTISKVAITKTKLNQREINKKKKTSKRSVFQDLSFIGSHCEVFGALGFSCITLLIYGPKIFQELFCFKSFKIRWFHVFNQNLVSNAFQSCLKGFKLKMMVVELKTAQPVESDEELIDLFNSIGQRVQKFSLSSRMLVQLTDKKLG